MHLIHIKDILENKEYIYNTDQTKDFKNCINFLTNKLSDEKQKTLKYNIFENHCEIYYENEVKNKGWVWSSVEIRRDIIYILSKIEILNSDNNKVDNSSQTKQEFQTQTENILTSSNFITKNHISNCIYNHNNQNDYNKIYNYYDDNYYYDNQTQIKPLNNQLTSGYAKNPIMPMWPDNLMTELEEKFSTLNFGLNHTNPNYF